MLIIDFEFNSLDNSFIHDSEIIQMKVKNILTGKSHSQNFGSNKKLSAHAQIIFGTSELEGPLFSDIHFYDVLNRVGFHPDMELFGFSVSKDLEMLAKYNIAISINDIQTRLQLSQYAYRMATEGHSLEDTYFICTSKVPFCSHADCSELDIIETLYHISTNVEIAPYFFIMPWGHCAGMPIDDYVINYRRSADGYRFNNSDTLSDSLTQAIHELDDEDDDY